MLKRLFAFLAGQAPTVEIKFDSALMAAARPGELVVLVAPSTLTPEWRERAFHDIDAAMKDRAPDVNVVVVPHDWKVLVLPTSRASGEPR